MSPEEHPRKHRARKGDGPLLREKIVEAAIAEMLNTERTEPLTMRYIATKIGVSAPAIYIHFSSKEALLFEASERIAAAGIALRVAQSKGDNPIVDLLTRMSGIMDNIQVYPDVYRTLMMTDREFTPDDYRGNKVYNMVPFQTSLSAISQAQKLGQLSADLDPHVSSLMVLFLMHGYLTLRLTKPDLEMPDQDELLGAISRLLIGGFGGDIKLVDDIIAGARNQRIIGADGATA